MRVSGVAAALVAACLASGAWAGEDKSWSGESGAPAPLTGRYVLTVQSQRVQITVLEPLPRHMVEAVIRVEYVLKNEGQETQRVAVGFPVCHQEAPTGEREWWGPWPEAYVKLDGRPVEARLAMFRELARPTVERWSGEIQRLLERRPALKEQVAVVQREAEQHSKGWLEREGASRLAGWLRANAREEELKGFHAGWVAGGLLGVRPDSHWGRLDQAVQSALRWLEPSHESVDLYEELSQEWGHEELLLDAKTGQLVDARSIAREHLFGAFLFEIEVEPGGEHRLVVQHRQPLGFLGMGNTLGLRYILTRAKRWGGYFRPTIEVRVPKRWARVAMRPPAMEVATTDGATVHRIELKGRPVEELYVSVRRGP
jgi:hypothetical protein